MMACLWLVCCTSLPECLILAGGQVSADAHTWCFKTKLRRGEESQLEQEC